MTLALAVACAGPGPEPASVPAWTLRERHAAVKIGQTPGEVASLLGSLPVRRPGHPDDPFSTPLHVAEWVGPAHERIRLEVYVVEARPAGGCPDVQYDDAPVVFVDGRVAGTTWEFVEQHWRDWGGDLRRLRRLQDRFSCEPPSDPPA